MASILRPKIARQLTLGEFSASKLIQPESSGCFVSTDGKDLIESPSEFCPKMESRPTPNILHDHPINNVVKKDWIHLEALRKEWRSVEQMAKAEPKYHINPYKK